MPPASVRIETYPVVPNLAVLADPESMSPRGIAVEDVWATLASDLLSDDSFNQFLRLIAQAPPAPATATPPQA